MPPNQENKASETVNPAFNVPQNPIQTPIQPRVAEKIIQPLNPNITSNLPITPVQPRPVINNVNSAVTSTYDPTADNVNYRVPSLDLRQPLEDNSIKRVALKHKSLMILAILGLISTVFTIYSVIQVSHAIQNAQAANQNTGFAQVGLDIIYGGIVFNLIIYIYFLLAKDSHTVAIVLKVLLVLEFISVFGVFWGGSPTKGFSLLINGAYLLFTYIVFNVVKT
jgi:hypothetical protein